MSSAASERREVWRVFTRSLALRFGLLYAALFVVSFAVLLGASHGATRASLERVEREALLEELSFQRERHRERTTADHGAADRRDDMAGSGATAACGPPPFFVRVGTDAGATLHREGPRLAPPDAALGVEELGVDERGAEGQGPETPGVERGERSRHPPRFDEVEGLDSRHWTVATARLDDDRLLQVGLSAAWRDASLRELRWRYAWILVLASLIGLLGGVLLTRRMLRPIRELAGATRRVVRQGDFGARVARSHRGDEVDGLARSFNDMLARNERLVRGMRDALDHVAHDLRTPLTRLRGAAELALRERDAGAQRDALADVVEESDRVLSMLRTMTDISEAESGALRLSKRKLELGAVAREVVDLYAHVAEEAGVTLRADLREPVAMQADAVRIAQALANLVDNAVKYTRPGGQVVVEVASEGRAAVLRVRDSGIGIPAESLPRIWERLYRVDASRSQRGLGLGLSFVKAIVEAHGGVAQVTSTPGRGSTFELRLPR